MKSKILKFILIGISILYGLLLIKIVLFKSNSLTDILRLNVSSIGYRSVNLIPFETISSFMNHGHFLRAFSNIVGNIIIFIPLGYFLTMFTASLNKVLKVALVCFGVSVLFECLQYIFYLGSLDIDDVILNTVGGGLGYLIYQYLKQLIKKQEVLYKLSIASCVFAFAIGFTIAKEEFGSVLGITSHEVVMVGEEFIPQRTLDYYGEVIHFNDSAITVDNDEVLINAKTKFYSINSADEKLDWLTTQTTVEYKALSKDKVMELLPHSRISVWLEGEFADVVLIHKEIYDGELMIETISL